MPIVPIFIAVIVLGFVIGAGASFIGHRNEPVALATQSPPPVQQEVTDPPVVLVTPAPTEKPTPEPTDEPTEKPTPTPKPTAKPKPVAKAVAAVTPEPSPSDEFASPEAEPSGEPREAASAAASSAPAGTPSSAGPAAASEGDSSFVRLSSDVVQQYLLAVAHGDDVAAYAALGASPGDRGANLTEAGVVDTKTRFGRPEAQPLANGSVVVTVPFTSALGSYVGTYTVRRNETGAAVIVAHSLSKS